MCEYRTGCIIADGDSDRQYGASSVLFYLMKQPHFALIFNCEMPTMKQIFLFWVPWTETSDFLMETLLLLLTREVCEMCITVLPSMHLCGWILFAFIDKGTHATTYNYSFLLIFYFENKIKTNVIFFLFVECRFCSTYNHPYTFTKLWGNLTSQLRPEYCIKKINQQITKSKNNKKVWFLL